MESAVLAGDGRWTSCWLATAVRPARTRGSRLAQSVGVLQPGDGEVGRSRPDGTPRTERRAGSAPRLWHPKEHQDQWYSLCFLLQVKGSGLPERCRMPRAVVAVPGGFRGGGHQCSLCSRNSSNVAPRLVSFADCFKNRSSLASTVDGSGTGRPWSSSSSSVVSRWCLPLRTSRKGRSEASVASQPRWRDRGRLRAPARRDVLGLLSVAGWR